MSILCSLQNLNLHYGHKGIFEDAKLTIEQGEKIGLIGLNGQGKSTLFKVLSLKLEPDNSTPPFIFDRNTSNFSVCYIPQELNVEDFQDLQIHNYYLSFYPELYKAHQELQKLQEKMNNNDLSEKVLEEQQKHLDKFETLGGWEIESAYQNYLKTFELTDTDRFLSRLSGGEQRKMALSIGLSAKEELVLWDEPTNHLDVETIELFEQELQSSSNTSMIITHDRYLLNNVADKIVHIESGKINSFKGSYLDYLDYLEEKEKERKQILTKRQNTHRRELAWMRQGIKARGTRSKKRVETYENLSAQIKDLKSKSRKVASLNLAHSGRKSKRLLEIKDGSFSYGDKLIFKDLNISVTKTDKIALIGPNGAGKTTLIKLINDQLSFSSGELDKRDELKVLTFTQKRDQLDISKTPKELVGEGLDFVHLSDGTQKHVITYLEEFLFSKDQINRSIETLSGGEKNRLQLALFMKQSADIWIFDEPTNDLDIETIEILEQVLADYQSAVIIIGHDRAFLDNICTTSWLLNENSIETFEGGYSQLAPYIEALKLEAKAKELAPVKKITTENQTSTSSKEKMNYNQKKRWKVIEEEIMVTEEKLELLNTELAAFNFTDPSEELTASYQKLNEEQQQIQTKVSALFEEWELLSSLEE